MAHLAPPADVGRDAWYRLMIGWHLVFAVLAASTGVLLLVDDSLEPARRHVGAGLLIALCAWYMATGAKALHREPDRRGALYLALAAPLTVGLFAVSPLGAVMLFLLYPHLWALLPHRRAVAGTGLVVVATSAVMLAWTGLDLGDAGYVLASAVVGLFVAIALGMWITRVIEQSRRRARLVAELAETRAELAAMSHRSGVLAERERLAREVHDTLAQGFSSLLLLLEAVDSELGPAQRSARDRLERARRVARDSLAEARAFVAAGTPPRLRERSLTAALQRVVKEAAAELPDGATLAVRGNPRALPADQEVVMLRALQEALANVRRHSGARRVEVQLEYEEGAPRTSLRVIDNGRGFDPAVRNGGFGLNGLERRVEQVGGSVQVRSAPAAGVMLSVEIES